MRRFRKAVQFAAGDSTNVKADPPNPSEGAAKPVSDCERRKRKRRKSLQKSRKRKRLENEKESILKDDAVSVPGDPGGDSGDAGDRDIKKVDRWSALRDAAAKSTTLVDFLRCFTLHVERQVLRLAFFSSHFSVKINRSLPPFPPQSVQC